MGRVSYRRDEKLEALARDIAETLGFEHINSHRIICLRSRGSKTNAYARIWAFPRIYQVALGIGPFYVIEFIEENFCKLSEKEKIKTIIHELMHIPKAFSGSILGHKQGKITAKAEERLYREYVRRKKEQL